MYSSNDFKTTKCIFEKGDVLYSKLRPYLKKYFLARFNGIASTEFWVFSPKNIESIFLLYLVESDFFNAETNKTCGTKMPRADWNVVKQLPFWISYSRKEQIKIGLFLSKLDQKINIISSKIKALKKYKEGLVLKALKPTIENWKQGSVCGIRLSSFLVPYKKLSTSEHHIHATLSKEGISGKTERYNRDFLVKDDNKKYRLTDKGDLVYNPANLKFGVICINNYGTCVVSPIYETFKVKNIDSDLLEAIVTSKTFIRYALKFEEGTVYERRAVSVTDLLSIKICVDDNNLFNISNTLRIIQEKIAILNHIKEQYCNFKTYLLNGMFI